MSKICCGPRAPWVLLSVLALLVFANQYVHASAKLGGASNLFSWSQVMWTPTSLPNPMTDPLKCGRHEGIARSAVCDPEKLLSRDEQDEVEGHINIITEKTATQVSVVIISRMDPKHWGTGQTKEKMAENFSIQLHNDWGVGSSEKNDGILVFLAVADRVLFISTGSGVQHAVTESAVQGIIANMRPQLKKKRYDIALIDCVITIGVLLSGEQLSIPLHAQKPSIPLSERDWMPLVWFVFFLGISVFLGLRQSRQLRNFERGRRALDSLMHEVENNSEDNRYFATSCPICLEDLCTEKQPDVAPQGTEEATADAVEPSSFDESTSSADNISNEAAMKKNDDLHTAAATAGVPAVVKKKPMALRCGHTFCSDCLTTYLRGNDGTRCPICRHPVHEDFAPPPAPAPSAPPGNTQIRRRPTHDSSSGGNGGSGSSCAESMGEIVDSDALPTTGTSSSSSSSNFSTGLFRRRSPEIRFRLNRMRYLYPDVMTAELLRSMNTAVDRGSLTDFRTGIATRSAEVQQRVTEMRNANAQAARRSGSRGHSGGSFGGGRSSGGGGGSW